MPRVAFIGGSRFFRGGLKVVLEEAGAEIVAEYGSSEEAARQNACLEKPLVYLLKPSPAGSVCHEIRILRNADPDARIAVLAEQLAPDQLVEVFAAGGDGLLLEEIGAPALNHSLLLIALGEKVFPSQLATLLSGERAVPRPLAEQVATGSLTQREIEIVRSLTAGLSNKEIANALNLAVATVKVHIKSLLKKLGLSNRTQAAIWALHAGLAEPPRVTVRPDAVRSDAGRSDAGSDGVPDPDSGAPREPEHAKVGFGRNGAGRRPLSLGSAAAPWLAVRT